VAEFVKGDLPYIYLTLDTPDTLRQLRNDLRRFSGIDGLCHANDAEIDGEYRKYTKQRGR